MGKTVMADSYNPGNGLKVTSGYPFRDDGVTEHKGVDWSFGNGTSSAGTKIVSALGGVVKFSRDANGYGKWVVIETTMPDGSIIKNIYGHVVGEVAEGSIVKAGQVIGHIVSKVELLSGSGTLNKDFTAPHLHNQLETKESGSSVFNRQDPLTFFNWQGEPHVVTDTSGKILIAKESSAKVNLGDGSQATEVNTTYLDLFGTKTKSQKETITTDPQDNNSSKSVLQLFDANGKVIDSQESYTDGTNTFKSVLYSGGKSNGNSVFNTEQTVVKEHNNGNVSDSFYNFIMQQGTASLVANTTPAPSPFIPSPVVQTPPSTPSTPSKPNFSSIILNPIGAFYESTSPINDNAVSIASMTPVLLGSDMKGLSVGALSLLDTNSDNKLSGNELNSISAWADSNEDGIAQSTEIRTMNAQGISEVISADYGFYTQGNSAFIAPTAIPTTPESNYRTLRDTDNSYRTGTQNIYQNVSTEYTKISGYTTLTLPGNPIYDYRGRIIGNEIITKQIPSFTKYTETKTVLVDTKSIDHIWSPSEIKINYNNQSYLIGTDGDDVVGGSARNDNVWGGTGNDTYGIDSTGDRTNNNKEEMCIAA